MHRAFANKKSITGPPSSTPSYYMKFPPQANLLDAMTQVQKRMKREQPPFTGMCPDLKNDAWFKEVSFC
jgi:hypothetical protein